MPTKKTKLEPTEKPKANPYMAKLDSLRKRHGTLVKSLNAELGRYQARPESEGTNAVINVLTKILSEV